MKRYFKTFTGVLWIGAFILVFLVFAGGAFAAGARPIAVGVGNAFEPYAYIDADNQPAGYDVAVLKAVDERLSQYEFSFESMEFKNLLLSIDAGKLDIATQQFETNPERAAKYLFTTEGFANYDKRLIVKKGRTDIKTIGDLAGKRVAVGSGTNSAAILEKYNAEHGAKIEIVYQGTTQVYYDNLVNGRIDAAVMTRRVFNRTNEALGGGMDIVEDGLFSKSDAYFILAKNETQLRDDIDAALREMKKDGTLTKLSLEYTGKDYQAD
ncbi:MAG: transporter substrate-binding domain-containing protein [Synergistaceae bacterium]|jgi:ABC-type amino acid transport substrate-binding protein|nr:transporter substrate-binding domain-containing protein [Synergistaceae bacterium]